MANGGWSGTQEAWDQVERPLPSLDPIFETFAEQHGFALSKNGKDWPERSLSKDMPLPSLIQVFRVTLEDDSWKVWAFCIEDRGSERYWKREVLADGVTGQQLAERLSGLLDQGRNRLVSWNAHREDFEFATVVLRPTSWL